MYKLITVLGQTIIYKEDEKLWIPQYPKNSEYQKYLKWEAAGNVAEPEHSAAEQLALAKDTQKTIVRNAFDSDCLSSVPALGIAWNGGFDSAIKLDAARRLAEAAGSAYVKFYDNANLDHVLSQPDALQVCIAVAMDYQAKLAKKQTAFNAIENASSIEEVEQVAY